MDVNTFANFIQYVLPTGRAALISMIAEFKEAYGGDWKNKFVAENPEFSFLVDIVANHDAPAAFQQLKSYVGEIIDGENAPTYQKVIMRGGANALLDGNYSNILETHKALREEMDKPRF